MDSFSRTAPLAVRSTLLRSVLLLELDGAAGRILSVRELCAGLERRGFTVHGRTSKVVSDALRVELSRGRVYRPSRGRGARRPRPAGERSRDGGTDATSGTSPARAPPT